MQPSNQAKPKLCSNARIVIFQFLPLKELYEKAMRLSRKDRFSYIADRTIEINAESFDEQEIYNQEEGTYEIQPGSRVDPYLLN